MSFVVRKIKNSDKYYVWDKELNEPIELPLVKQEANQIARKLNLGSGFEGRIPTFVMRAI